ncbi:MAG: hypothetical protein Q9M91_06845 [Candidatus Dojkabacteria bacterium]|nr:hypothetical protein [Candidatus Dojkabacteria bacterium]
MIALINIGLGVFVGLFMLRYKNHCIQWKLNTGLSSTFLTVGLSIIFNLLVAHYRAALTIDPDHAAELAIKTFSEGIFSVSDVNSRFLFLLE